MSSTTNIPDGECTTPTLPDITDAQAYGRVMHHASQHAADVPTVPAVTESLIFEVVKRTGHDFGVVSNVLWAARTALLDDPTTA